MKLGDELAQRVDVGSKKFLIEQYHICVQPNPMGILADKYFTFLVVETVTTTVCPMRVRYEIRCLASYEPGTVPVRREMHMPVFTVGIAYRVPVCRIQYSGSLLNSSTVRNIYQLTAHRD